MYAIVSRLLCAVSEAPTRSVVRVMAKALRSAVACDVDDAQQKRQRALHMAHVTSAFLCKGTNPGHVQTGGTPCTARAQTENAVVCGFLRCNTKLIQCTCIVPVHTTHATTRGTYLVGHLFQHVRDTHVGRVFLAGTSSDRNGDARHWGAIFFGDDGDAVGQGGDLLVDRGWCHS